MKKILASFTVLAAAAAVVIGGTTAFFSDTETSTGNTFTAGAIDLKIDSVAHYNGMVCALVNDSYEWVPSEYVTLDNDNHPTIISQDYNAANWNDANPAAYPKAGTVCTGTWELQDLGSDDQQSSVAGLAFFSYNDLKPGDFGENTISLHVENNEAWACVAIDQVEDADNTLTEPEAAVDPDDLTSGELTENMSFFVWEDDGDNLYEPDGDDQGAWSAQVSGSDIQDGVLPLADSQNGNDPLDPNSVGYIGLAWCLGDINVDTNGAITCDGENVGNEVQTDSLSFDALFSVVQSRNNADFVCGDLVGDQRDIRSSVGTTWASVDGNFTEAWQADGRWGDGGTTPAENEVRIGNPGGNSPIVQAHGDNTTGPWRDGVVESFTLTYDGSGNATLTIGDVSIDTTSVGLNQLPGADGKLGITIKTKDSGETVELTNVKLDGISPVSDDSATASDGSKASLVLEGDTELSDGFTLTGNVEFSWDSAPTSNESMGILFQIEN